MLSFLLLLAATPKLDRCLNSGEAANGVTLAMADCFAAEQRRADGALNRAYGAAMARSSPTRKSSLRASERKWIRDRDAACRRVLGPDRGTIQQVNYPACLARQTRLRTTWLRGWR